MIDEDIQIQAADEMCEAVLCRPERQGRWPGVIQLTDIGGIRPATREMARRLAAEGYIVLTPNVFYRTRRLPVFDFPMNFAEERTKKRLAELSTPLSPEAMERDASHYVDFLLAHECAAGGLMGVVGYCFSGKMALRTAAVRADKIAAAASFHGGGLYTEEPSSPHLLLPRIKARLYFAHAVKDRSMPEEAVAKLNAALVAWGGRYETEVYEGAYHSWTVSDSPVYNQGQADRAFAQID